ncbi:MAG: transcriptional repressor [Saccharospirillum sp.]|nr:transcriptional repressor [Saccharospirillum sp.]
MNGAYENILNKASQQCRDRGERLTPKRERLLALLLEADGPKSAYDLIAEHEQVYGESLAAMSVYRMLNFLVEAGLVHKLATTNQFLACSHISCDHAHEVPQFLICDDCHGVEEVGMQRNLLNELKASAAKVGFTMGGQQLELHGRCQKCSGSETN